MNNNFNNFNNMDDLFNQLMGGMRGYSSENRRYQEMQNLMRKCNNTLQV